MAFISLQNIYLSYGPQPLLDHLDLHVEQNQRICLLGKNGSGKSTLMNIMAGKLEPDTGERIVDKKVRFSYLGQDIPDRQDGLVFDCIARGLADNAAAVIQYYKEEEGLKTTAGNPADQHIHNRENWAAIQQIKRLADELHINCAAPYNSLSGGQKRRVLLAAALISKPDMLLLDEPTNHLDVPAIIWLEEYILAFCPTILFVTHDRSFLKNIADRIVELDRGRLYDYHCNYDLFLERKQAFLAVQEKEWAKFDKKLSEEEIWLRKGIKARRTRNEGRVRALQKMREQRRQRREQQGPVSVQIQGERQSGKKVLTADRISFAYADQKIVDDFSAVVSRGDKIGIIGANGCGKTTLLHLLLGHLVPDRGSVTQGTNLELAFFDQMRAQIDPDKSLQENVQPNGDVVTVNGTSKHIVSYLSDFLFSAERCRTPVAHLSGGEKNRLLLAKLFTKSCNLLVMDEPTNDLDAETLELLEDLIVAFDGTVLLISHDRTFLNNTTGSLFVFQEPGQIVEIAGGYDDWLTYQQARQQQIDAKKELKKPDRHKKQRPKQKLTFNEQKELEQAPLLIEELETAITQLHRQMAEPELYLDYQKMQTAKQQVEELEKSLAAAYQRWDDLEREKEKVDQQRLDVNR